MLPLVVIHLPSGPVMQQQEQPLYHCLPEDLQATLNVGMLLCYGCYILLCEVQSFANEYSICIKLLFLFGCFG